MSNDLKSLSLPATKHTREVIAKTENDPIATENAYSNLIKILTSTMLSKRYHFELSLDDSKMGMRPFFKQFL